jgi:hypothetical protein
MASIAEVIDYLMHLMQDDNAQREFDRDPDGALANRGLADVTGQDVRDARLMMADCGAVNPRSDRPAHSGSGSDPVREIHHTTSNFTVGDVTTTVISVQDNDTLAFDSFNNDVTAIQDNDTTDVDVISIVDNDGDDTGTDSGDEDDEPEGTPEDEPAGELPGDEPVTGGEADPGAVVGTAPESGDELASVDGFEVEPESDALDSGAGEGFAPEEDSGFGVQQELGTEAGLTPADESFDELAG